MTGARADRRQLLNGLSPGDIATVTRIDRLARSAFDLFAIVKQIVDAEAQFRSFAEPRADTGTSTGRLLIAARRTGRRGARLYPHPHCRMQEPRQGPGAADGPTAAIDGYEKAEARQRRAQGATLAELARSYDVNRSTISRFVLGPSQQLIRRECGIFATS